MARRSGSSTFNALIALDKPLGLTSHDVVARVRSILGERRVGHAGTLDPMASGVMVLGIGQAARLLGLLTLERKSYIADIAFGAETDTDDATGAPRRYAPCSDTLWDEDFARDALMRVQGEHMQTPPAFSAVSKGGERAYAAARKGHALELAARPVRVEQATLLAIHTQHALHEDGDAHLSSGAGDTPALQASTSSQQPCPFPVWTCSFTVSKGTYIRSLARDLGRELGSAAHLSALRRTASGAVTLADCIALDDLNEATVSQHILDPVRCLGIPALKVPCALIDDIAHGRALPPALVELCPSSSLYALVYEGRLLALAERRGETLSYARVFPQPIKGVCP